MAAYKVERRLIRHNGRVFNFITYDALAANPKKGEAAKPASWFLIASTKRWEVFPHVKNQLPEELDNQLIEWLDEHVFA